MDILRGNHLCRGRLPVRVPAVRWRAWPLLLILLLPVLSRADGIEQPWQRLSYFKSYLWLEASAQLELETVPAEGNRWRAPIDKRVQARATKPDQPLWQLTSSSRIASNSEEVRALLNPDDQSIYQRFRISVGKQQRLKSYQYFTDNLMRMRREPGADENSLPSTKWSRITRQLLPYPADLIPEMPLTSVNGLLLGLSSAPLTRPGDVYITQVHTDLDFYRVECSVDKIEEIEVSYTLAASGALEQKTGRVKALVIAIKPLRLGKGPENDPFSLLGLTGDIRVLLDPESRLPLQLRGEAPRMGLTAIDLTEAEVGNAGR